MKSVGRIAITGTIGYDLSFIRLVPTPTGRKIRFVTNRLVRFGENYYNTQSTAYNLTAGEIEINDADKNKSGGVATRRRSWSLIRRASLSSSSTRIPGSWSTLLIGTKRALSNSKATTSGWAQAYRKLEPGGHG